MVSQNANETKFVPTVFLIMWNGRDETCFSETPLNSISKLKHFGYSVFSFYGKSATVHVGTTEVDLYKEDALKVATTYVKGNYETVNVDLDRCTATYTKGRPLSDLQTPRY